MRARRLASTAWVAAISPASEAEASVPAGELSAAPTGLLSCCAAAGAAPGAPARAAFRLPAGEPVRAAGPARAAVPARERRSSGSGRAACRFGAAGGWGAGRGASQQPDGDRFRRKLRRPDRGIRPQEQHQQVGRRGDAQRGREKAGRPAGSWLRGGLPPGRRYRSRRRSGRPPSPPPPGRRPRRGPPARRSPLRCGRPGPRTPVRAAPRPAPPGRPAGGFRPGARSGSRPREAWPRGCGCAAGPRLSRG